MAWSSRCASRSCRSCWRKSRRPRIAASAAGRPFPARASARSIRSAPSRASVSCISPAVTSGPMGTRSAIATGPVSRPSSIFITITPVSRSPAMMARWIGAAPRQRGNSEACRVETAERKSIQDRFRQDQPVGHDHGRIGAVCAHRRCGVGTLQSFRRQNRQPKPLRFARDRARPQLHAASGRLWRARIDRHDLMSGTDDFQKCGHGEIGRAHEHEAQRQLGLHLGLLCLARCFGRLGEFLRDAIALEF